MYYTYSLTVLKSIAQRIQKIQGFSKGPGGLLRTVRHTPPPLLSLNVGYPQGSMSRFTAAYRRLCMPILRNAT